MTPTSSANIRRHLSQKCAHLGIPSSGIFELTPRCNLNCKMCYVRLTPQQMAPVGAELTAQQWICLAKEAKNAGMVFLLITGGEPTLRSDFAQIYEELTKLGLSISINTNGTLITDEIKALWRKLPPAQVNITLYGTCQEDYQDLCGNGAAFDAVTDALDWLKANNILVHLNATIDSASYKKWQALEDFAKDRNLELRVQSYCFPPLRRPQCTACNEFARISPDEAGRLVADEILYREGYEAVKLKAENLSSPLQKSCDLDLGEPMQCLAGRSQFWVTWNGDMTPCGTLPTPKTTPLTDGFIGAWNKMREIISSVRLCPECSKCDIANSCMNCAAVTFAETGHFDGKPEYMCKLNEAYRARITELAKNC